MITRFQKLQQLLAKAKKQPAFRLLVFALIFIVVGTVIFNFNYHTPLYADDYSYSFSKATGERISSVRDIFYSMYAQYFTSNGRLVTHFLAQLFLYLGMGVFNIINTFGFLMLGILIYWHSGFRIRKHSPLWLATIYILLYLLPPAFGQSFLWLTGSANYLYGIMIILIFFLPYRQKLSGCNLLRKKNIFLLGLAAVGNLVAGAIAGATNENTGVALIVMIFLTMLTTRFIHKQRISLWMLTGFAGSIIGCAFILLSPGISSRVDSVGGFGGVTVWIKRAILITFNAGEFLWPAVLLLAVVCICLYATKKTTIKEMLPVLCTAGVFLMGTLASIYSMMVSPEFPNRAWSGTIVLIIITIGVIVKELRLEEQPGIGDISAILVSLMAVCMLCSSLREFYVLKNIEHEYLLRVQSIEEQIAAGETDIYIEAISSDSKYSCFLYTPDVLEDSTVWPNTAIARYYGVDSVNILH